jgi:hypothetical protein
MPTAGYLANVKVSGSAVSMTTEAMTSLGSNLWQITNSAKRVISPSATLTIAGGTVLWVDRLFGLVKFTGAATTPTVTGSYLPMTTVASGRSWSVSCKASNVDATTFINGAASTAFVSRKQAILDVSGSIGALWVDGLGASFIDTSALACVELYTVYSATPDLKCWAYVSGDSLNTGFDQLVSEDFQFEGAIDNDGRSFSFGA